MKNLYQYRQIKIYQVVCDLLYLGKGKLTVIGNDTRWFFHSLAGGVFVFQAALGGYSSEEIKTRQIESSEDVFRDKKLFTDFAEEVFTSPHRLRLMRVYCFSGLAC